MPDMVAERSGLFFDTSRIVFYLAWQPIFHVTYLCSDFAYNLELPMRVFSQVSTQLNRLVIDPSSPCVSSDLASSKNADLDLSISCCSESNKAHVVHQLLVPTAFLLLPHGDPAASCLASGSSALSFPRLKHC